MNILVVGGAGFLGSHVVRRYLQEPGNHVTVLDSLEPELHATTAHLRPLWDRIRFVRGSMGHEPIISEVVQGQDIIINLAAQTSHPRSIQNPILDAEINCLGNLRLLEAVRLLNKTAVIVYASSSTVIGKAAAGEVVDEDHAERPLDIYSANKGAAEKYYRIYHRVHDLRTIVLRFANLYGPFGKGQPEFGFVNHFIHLARAGERIRIFGDGGQTRNVLYAEDAADLICTAGRSPRLFGEVYFATHDHHLSVKQIAEQIVGCFGRGTVEHVEWPDDRRRIEVEGVQYSSARLCSLVNWRPRFSFLQGLERTRIVMDGQSVES